MAEYNFDSYTKLKHQRHPVQWVRSLMKKINVKNQKITLNFSRYIYTPQSLKDTRTNFTVDLTELDDFFFIEQLSSLRENEELALHSQVVLNDNEVMHLPMIDFAKRKQNDHKFKPLDELCKYWNINLAIFDSGRSYHAYGDRLLTESEWIKFMGSLLLVNIPGKWKLIDDRWVGHRIIGGYSALRWSFNTSHYKRYPNFIGMLSEESPSQQSNTENYRKYYQKSKIINKHIINK